MTAKVLVGYSLVATLVCKGEFDPVMVFIETFDDAIMRPQSLEDGLFVLDFLSVCPIGISLSQYIFVIGFGALRTPSFAIF